MTIEQALILAIRQQQAGQMGEAEKLYRQILAQSPEEDRALHQLGVLAGQMGRADAAVEWIGRAIRRRPEVGIYHSNMGNALRGAGRGREALGAYGRAIELQPDLVDAHVNRANTLVSLGHVAEGMAGYRRAIELQSGCVEAHNNLGIALTEMGQLEEAVAAYEKALQFRPEGATIWNNLGYALTRLDRIEEAIAACEKAVRLNPGLADAHNNLGIALKSQLRIDAAMEAYRKAIEIEGNFADAHYNLSHMFFFKGDLVNGWIEHEWRKKVASLSPIRPHAQRLWRGEALAGRTILVHAEQGLGDTLQFIRFVPLIKRMGATVIVECAPQLVRLIGQMPEVGSVHGWGEELPACDFQCPMMSVPMGLGTRLETIPADVPYLRAIDSVAGVEKEGRDVGLVWAGNSGHKNDRNRSMALRLLSPLAKGPYRFHSLQVGPCSAQIGDVPELKLIDHSAELKDFADTARVVAGLDMVITVDTAIAHLAGAMGKAVWVLLPFVPDWRWMLDREDSPWYPTMRLFRQRRAGDWAGVVERVWQALEEWRR